MGWSCGENGRCNTSKERRCPEGGEEREARQTEIAIGIALKVTQKEWEKNGKNDIQKELETTDRERSKEK